MRTSLDTLKAYAATLTPKKVPYPHQGCPMEGTPGYTAKGIFPSVGIFDFSDRTGTQSRNAVSMNRDFLEYVDTGFGPDDSGVYKALWNEEGGYGWWWWTDEMEAPHHIAMLFKMGEDIATVRYQDWQFITSDADEDMLGVLKQANDSPNHHQSDTVEIVEVDMIPYPDYSQQGRPIILNLDTNVAYVGPTGQHHSDMWNALPHAERVKLVRASYGETSKDEKRLMADDPRHPAWIEVAKHLGIEHIQVWAAKESHKLDGAEGRVITHTKEAASEVTWEEWHESNPPDSEGWWKAMIDPDTMTGVWWYAEDGHYPFHADVYVGWTGGEEWDGRHEYSEDMIFAQGNKEEVRWARPDGNKALFQSLVEMARESKLASKPITVVQQRTRDTHGGGLPFLLMGDTLYVGDEQGFHSDLVTDSGFSAKDYASLVGRLLPNEILIYREGDEDESRVKDIKAVLDQIKWPENLGHWREEGSLIRGQFPNDSFFTEVKLARKQGEYEYVKFVADEEIQEIRFSPQVADWWSGPSETHHYGQGMIDELSRVKDGTLPESRNVINTGGVLVEDGLLPWNANNGITPKGAVQCWSEPSDWLMEAIKERYPFVHTFYWNNPSQAKKEASVGNIQYVDHDFYDDGVEGSLWDSMRNPIIGDGTNWIIGPPGTHHFGLWQAKGDLDMQYTYAAAYVPESWKQQTSWDEPGKLFWLSINPPPDDEEVEQAIVQYIKANNLEYQHERTSKVGATVKSLTEGDIEYDPEEDEYNSIPFIYDPEKNTLYVGVVGGYHSDIYSTWEESIEAYQAGEKHLHHDTDWSESSYGPAGYIYLGVDGTGSPWFYNNRYNHYYDEVAWAFNQEHEVKIVKQAATIKVYDVGDTYPPLTEVSPIIYDKAKGQLYVNPNYGFAGHSRIYNWLNSKHPAWLQSLYDNGEHHGYYVPTGKSLPLRGGDRMPMDRVYWYEGYQGTPEPVINAGILSALKSAFPTAEQPMDMYAANEWQIRLTKSDKPIFNEYSTPIIILHDEGQVWLDTTQSGHYMIYNRLEAEFNTEDVYSFRESHGYWLGRQRRFAWYDWHEKPTAEQEAKIAEQIIATVPVYKESNYEALTQVDGVNIIDTGYESDNWKGLKTPEGDWYGWFAENGSGDPHHFDIMNSLGVLSHDYNAMTLMDVLEGFEGHGKRIDVGRTEEAARVRDALYKWRERTRISKVEPIDWPTDIHLETDTAFGYVAGKLYLGGDHHLSIMQDILKDHSMEWLMEQPQAWGWIMVDYEEAYSGGDTAGYIQFYTDEGRIDDEVTQAALDSLERHFPGKKLYFLNREKYQPSTYAPRLNEDKTSVDWMMENLDIGTRFKDQNGNEFWIKKVEGWYDPPLRYIMRDYDGATYEWPQETLRQALENGNLIWDD